jgi:hypothetical protein
MKNFKWEILFRVTTVNMRSKTVFLHTEGHNLFFELMILLFDTREIPDSIIDLEPS